MNIEMAELEVEIWRFNDREAALLHFRTPLFLLMILVQNFMLIKNHIETWVWKSTETKLFTVKVL